MHEFLLEREIRLGILGQLVRTVSIGFCFSPTYLIKGDRTQLGAPLQGTGPGHGGDKAEVISGALEHCARHAAEGAAVLCYHRHDRMALAADHQDGGVEATVKPAQ